jgi:hypothetical protein
MTSKQLGFCRLLVSDHTLDYHIIGDSEIGVQDQLLMEISLCSRSIALLIQCGDLACSTARMFRQPADTKFVSASRTSLRTWLAELNASTSPAMLHPRLTGEGHTRYRERKVFYPMYRKVNNYLKMSNL